VAGTNRSRVIKSTSFIFALCNRTAGHSKENYIRDFHTVLPIATPGAVILMDDIRWEDSRFSRDNPRCYEGWLEVVNHPTVRRAVEISGSMGLLLLGQ
jgi:predicted O-methyltransferase YrrM